MSFSETVNQSDSESSEDEEKSKNEDKNDIKMRSFPKALGIINDIT